MTEPRSAGWYADPATVGAARYWDGHRWTDLVSWGGETRQDPTPLAEVDRRATLAEARVVSAYLADAARRGLVDPAVADVLRRDVERAVSGGVTSPRARASAPPVPPPPPAARSRAESTKPPAEIVRPLPSTPGRVAQWWGDTRQAVRSDLALHGLAYLGVILLFTGVTGLIAFSFGDVAPWVRSLTELMVPTALFLSAWYLNRRGAIVVAASLTILGGAISPIVVAASLTDGAPVPPDISGRLLPIVQGGAVATLAVVTMLVVRKSPSNPLRFLAVPMMWMAAGIAAGVGRDPVPAGYETARPDSLQLAVVLAALTATVILCAWRRAPATLVDATRVVALPVAGVVYVLEFVVAAHDGWPLLSTVVVTVATLVLLESLADRLPAIVTSGLQLVVLVTGSVRLAATAPPEWVAAGAAVAVLGFVEYVGWRRPMKALIVAGLGISAWALILTLDRAAPTAAAFGVLTIWGLWRHVRPADWLPRSDDVGVVPAVAAVVTTAALWKLSGPGPSVIVTATLVLVIAAGGRIWRPIGHDVLWQWFVPSAAGAVTVVSMGLPWAELPAEIAIASAMLAGAIILSAAPSSLRAWLTSMVVVWSLANTAAALDVTRDVQAISLAAMALVLVLGSLVVAKPICVHLAAIGHVAGFGALVATSWPGWATTSVVAAATLGWVATTIFDERHEAVHLAASRAAAKERSDRSEEAFADSVDVEAEVAALLSLVGTWATSLLAVDAGGWVAHDDPWAAAISAAIALVAAWAVRVTPWRRARRLVLARATLVGAIVAALVAISAAGPDRGDWSPVVSLALGLAVVGVTAAPRQAEFTWLGWTGTAALTVVLADRLGLDRDWTDVALAGWGATALVGGLTVHRARSTAVQQWSFVRDTQLLPPIALGAAAFVVGGILGLSEGSHTQIGWTAAGLSIVVLIIAMLLGLGALVALAEALMTAAYVLLAPWGPLERPWTFAPWALLLLGAALATRRSGRWSLARWDLPSFLVAHGVAGVALVAAVFSDTLVVTYAVFGTIAVAVALVLRRWQWAAAGAVLVLVAGADAGHGWLALVLLVEGIALTVSGLLQSKAARWTTLGLGALSLVGAWFDLAAWQGWAGSTVFYITVPGGGALALLAAIGLRTGAVPREFARVWAITGATVAVGTHALAGEAARLPGGLTTTVALLTLATAAGVTAVALGTEMRWVAVTLAAVAWAPAAWALEVSATTATLVGTTVALAGLTAALAVHGLRPGTAWLSPGSFYAAASQVGAALAALTALPDDDLLIVVLAAVSAELVAIGVVSDRPMLYVLSPAAACGAWLLYARDTLAGDANWFTVPVGFTVLVMVGLVRWIRRGRGGDPTGYDVIVLELVGMSLLVATALARTLAGHLWNGVLAIGIGVLIAGWGVVTRVRRRAGFGATSVVLAASMLIGVPLSRSITWRGPTLWLTLSVIGIAAIVVASGLERNRDRVCEIARHVDEMTEGWERIPFREDSRRPSTPGVLRG